jgi:hypothetical protein
MFRHAGDFTRSLLASALCLAGASSFSAPAAPPDFAPNPSAAWFAYSREFIPPPSGAGPVGPLPGHRHISNDEFRLTGRQATFALGDPDSPILKPWAADKIRERNAMLLSGKPLFSPHASCWPIGVPAFLLQPMTRPMYFVQGPKEVVMILTSFMDLRHVPLTDKHSANVKTSWYGESIGHYDGDTLVIDTVGIDERTQVDGYGTPHTKDLHVVERLHLINGGEELEANFHVEDAGAFTMPWDAIQRFRKYEATVAKMPLKSIPVLATPEEGPLTEAICAENPNSFLGLPAMPIPQAARPDF